MKRLLTSLAVLLSLTAGALGQRTILPTPEIRSGEVTFGGALTIGRRSGSKLDLSDMLATPTNGGIARSLTDLFSTQLYAINFGVIPGAPDSGPALRTAFLRAQALGARLILPTGAINVCGGADPEALLRIELFMDLVGSSQKSRIQPCADAGSRPVILIKPLRENGGIRGMVLRDFSIGIPGVPRSGGTGIKIDTTNRDGFVAKLLVENVGIAQGAAGTYAVHHFNIVPQTLPNGTPVGNVTGGLFASTFRDSDFTGGLKFEQTGDSNNIERSVINGSNEGIYYQPIVNAATGRIIGNNITATGDTIVVDGGQQIKILENQMEAVGTYTGSRAQPAVVTVIGSIDVVIRNNNMNAYTRADVVSVSGGAKGVRVEPNTATYASNKALFRAVASPGNIVERQTYENIGGVDATGRGVAVVDAASPTFGVWQQLTTKNGWVAGSEAGFRQGLWWMPLTDGTIRLSGSIAGGTTTAGTAIATLPVNFRPVGNALRFTSLVYLNNIVNGSAWGTGIYIADGAGNISVQSLPTIGAGAYLQFDSTNFSIRP